MAKPELTTEMLKAHGMGGRWTRSCPAGRFLLRVKKTPTCWLWKGCQDERGYGQIRINKALYKCHRVSWVLHRGPIPAGMDVLHECDNPACVNPDHLRLGTHADNMRDRSERGRTSRDHVRIGEKSPRARLTNDDVREIRERFAAGGVSKAALGREFGVSDVTICNLLLGRTYVSPEARTQPAKGKHPNQKVTPERAAAILVDVDAGELSTRAIGRKYGLSYETIRRVIARRK